MKEVQGLDCRETGGIVSFSASDFTACVSVNGKLYLWGKTLGQEICSATPIQGGTHFRSVRLGKSFGIAQTKEGRSFSWGENQNGELGTGDFDSLSEPKLVEHIAEYCVKDFAVGHNFTMALTYGKLSKAESEFLPSSYV